MRIATLSIGDEVVFGEIVDTNAPFIAQRLYDAGLKVHAHLAVGDVEANLVAILRTLAATSDAVVATGGLGPTSDDITAGAVAKATNRPLIPNKEALDHLRHFLAGRGRDVDPANAKQALIPEGAVLIPNPTGTACGFCCQLENCSFFFLPGVPKEMTRMVEESVIPALRKQTIRDKIIRIKVLKLFGIPEAEVGARLKGLARPDEPLEVAFQVEFPEIRVKLRVEGDDERQVERLLDVTSRRVREELEGYIFAEDDATMDSVVADLLRKKGITLALAESCTGGLLAKWITDIPGSSTYFLEGAVTYSNTAKIRAMGVSSRLLEEKGAVSPEVASAMAEGMRRLSGSDIALAVTGIAGPDGGTPEKPVGTIFLAFCNHAGCHTKGYRFFGNRQEIRAITAFTALDLLRRQLLSS